jgi:prepilin-type N-terminal cleavage/methylation domain-containing protein
MVDESLLSNRSFLNRRCHTGLTLVEVLVVLSIFSILLTAIYFIFQMGLSAWHKTATKNELLQQVQIVNFRLSKELERSSLGSLSADTALGIVAFLSPLDNDGVFVVGTEGRPEWQRYIVYYHNSAENVIYRTEIPLIAGASERRVPTLLEDYNDGSGPQPLAAYASGGRPLSRFVTIFEPTVFPAPLSQLNWLITAERRRYGSERPEMLTMTAAAYLRN